MSATKRYAVNLAASPILSARGDTGGCTSPSSSRVVSSISPSTSVSFLGNRLSSASACSKWVALPSALHGLVVSYLAVADCVHIDQTCHRMQLVARSATPGTSTLCMDVDPNYFHTVRTLAPISADAALHFVPHTLKLTTGASYVRPRSVALARAIRAGVAADAARGVRRLHTLVISNGGTCMGPSCAVCACAASALRLCSVSRLSEELLPGSRPDGGSDRARCRKRRE